MSNVQLGTPKRAGAAVKRIVSILPNDYVLMENKPQINGVELEGNLTAPQLSLLPAKIEEYMETTMSAIDKDTTFVVILGDNSPVKVSVNEFFKAEGMKTIDDSQEPSEALESASVGSYLFVVKTS